MHSRGCARIFHSRLVFPVLIKQAAGVPVFVPDWSVKDKIQGCTYSGHRKSLANTAKYAIMLALRLHEEVEYVAKRRINADVYLFVLYFILLALRVVQAQPRVHVLRQ